jgi:spermidine synthase
MSTAAKPPLRIAVALFLTALTTLMLELALTRVFDVVLTPNMAYMVIACTLFSFGLAGIYATLRPLPAHVDVHRRLGQLSMGLAVATLALRPALNVLPFDYDLLPRQPLTQLAAFAGMYLAMVVPFFLSGLIFTLLFSAHARAIQRLYCWDLTGAALGCVVMIPMLPPIGPGGLLMVAAAMNLLAAALFIGDTRLRAALAVVALVLVAVPALHAPAYFDFTDHLHKRGVREAREHGDIEFSRWDTVSKIDVIDVPGAVERKHVAYDGGNQSSHIFAFDGNFAALRAGLEDGSRSVFQHFWHRGVLVSHYLKRDSGADVLVVGAAGGQETKAALMYGAGHVDAIELVPTVVELGLTRYAEFNGGLFKDPRVSLGSNEGRAYLRASPHTYDIIQIHSNQTSSSIAAGTGALSPEYLQTADAYREYFTKLKPDGLLHVNHHTYPRVITTAALAWKQLGRDDFQRHVLIFEMHGVADTLPTILIKMTPWTAEQVAAARDFMTRPWNELERAELKGLFDDARDVGDHDFEMRMTQNPLEPANGFLEPAFFSGSFDETLAARAPYRLNPTTDDRPFFSMLRKEVKRVTPDDSQFVSFAIAAIMNSQMRGNHIAMDTVHLQVTALVSLLFALGFVIVPLRFAPVGREGFAHRAALVVYFASLGAGFIIIELVFVQIFMKLVGVPLYTYATVIFTLLLGAGIGSLCSGLLGIDPTRRWWWPFVGALACGVALLACHEAVFQHFLAADVALRALVAALLILPLAFCLGMPFPLGILAISGRATGAVAWAWALNGLFTVIGSLASVLLALWFGFKVTILIALGIYCIAALAFSRLKSP